MFSRCVYTITGGVLTWLSLTTSAMALSPATDTPSQTVAGVTWQRYVVEPGDFHWNLAETAVVEDLLPADNVVEAMALIVAFNTEHGPVAFGQDANGFPTMNFSDTYWLPAGLGEPPAATVSPATTATNVGETDVTALARALAALQRQVAPLSEVVATAAAAETAAAHATTMADQALQEIESVRDDVRELARFSAEDRAALADLATALAENTARLEALEAQPIVTPTELAAVTEAAGTTAEAVQLLTGRVDAAEISLSEAQTAREQLAAANVRQVWGHLVLSLLLLMLAVSLGAWYLRRRLFVQSEVFASDVRRITSAQTTFTNRLEELQATLARLVTSQKVIVNNLADIAPFTDDEWDALRNLADGARMVIPVSGESDKEVLGQLGFERLVNGQFQVFGIERHLGKGDPITLVKLDNLFEIIQKAVIDGRLIGLKDASVFLGSANEAAEPEVVSNNVETAEPEDIAA